MNRNMIPCCTPQIKPENSLETIERLESTIQALDVRCKSIWYQAQEALIKARNYKKLEDTDRCMAEMKRKYELMRTYKRFVNLHSNVVKVRDTIDETKTIGEIAGNMNIANRVLEEALKNVNPEKIDELMNQLEDGREQMHEIAGILGEDRGVFDEEEAMRELEGIAEAIPLINLPNVPNRQIRIKQTE